MLTALVYWPTLYYFAESVITKCKPVTVLQLSSTLMTGSMCRNPPQLSSKFELFKVDGELMRVGSQTPARVATLDHQLSSSSDLMCLGEE
jgi:hypothetical protein